MSEGTKAAREVQLGVPLAFVLSLLALSLYLAFGDKWVLLGDGDFYMDLFNGRPTILPFSYRILTPSLARLLPWDGLTDFKVVTWACLALTTPVLVIYGSRLRYSKFRILSLCILWMTSYAFIYYGTTMVRANAPVFLLTALFLLLAIQRAPVLLMVAIVSLGVLAHETMLIILLVLGLDKVFGGDLTGPNKYSYKQLIMTGVLTLGIYAVVRAVVPRAEADVLSYMNNPLGTIQYVINYSHGIPRHFLRIYATFGPALQLAVFFLLAHRGRGSRLSFGLLFASMVAASFLAADTLRVASIICFPLLMIAAEGLDTLRRNGKAKLAYALILLQLAYSLTVFGNVKTFQYSLKLELIAGAISLVAFLLLAKDFIARGKMRPKDVETSMRWSHESA